MQIFAFINKNILQLEIEKSKGKERGVKDGMQEGIRTGRIIATQLKGETRFHSSNFNRNFHNPSQWRIKRSSPTVQQHQNQV